MSKLNLFLSWLVVNTLGTMLSLVLFYGAFELPVDEEHFYLALVIHLLSGFPLGLIQFIYFRRKIEISAAFVVVTSTAWWLCNMIFVFASAQAYNLLTGPSTFFSIAFLIWAGLLSGLVFGVGGWLFLRGGLKPSSGWVLAYTLGWGIAGLLAVGSGVLSGYVDLDMMPTVPMYLYMGFMLEEVDPLFRSVIMPLGWVFSVAIAAITALAVARLPFPPQMESGAVD